MVGWMSAVAVGAIVGQYRITGQIASGGMGAVYVGEHLLIQRRAAIKIVAPRVSAQPDLVDRFFTEARAAAAINHPGIVQIFDFGFADDGTAYIVMELLDGKTLRNAIHDDGPLPMVAALRVARQIASAMAAAHAVGVLHRDLKPANIFLIADDEVAGGQRAKIVDFGIAKLVHRVELSTTSAGTILGTPMYMAPEQFRGAHRTLVTRRSRARSTQPPTPPRHHRPTRRRPRATTSAIPRLPGGATLAWVKPRPPVSPDRTSSRSRR